MRYILAQTDIPDDTEEKRKLAIFTADQSILKELAKDENVQVRKNVAGNPNVSDEILIDLMDDEDAGVRKKIIDSLPEEYLPEMMDDPSEEVRKSVAQIIQILDKSKLEEMIDDESPKVRKVVANKISPKKLPEMMDDENDGVRRRVANRINPDYLDEMIDKEYPRTMAKVISREPELVSELSEEETEVLINNISKVKEEVQGKVVEELAKKDENYLPKLIDKELDEIGKAVLINNIDSEYLPEMLKNEGDRRTQKEIIDEMEPEDTVDFVDHESDYVRVSVADKVPEKFLTEMMDDPSSAVRSRVAERIDEEHLPKMMNDEDDAVRAEVADRISKEYIPEIIGNEESQLVLKELVNRVDEEQLPDLISKLKSIPAKGEAVSRINDPDTLSNALSMALEDDDSPVTLERAKTLIEEIDEDKLINLIDHNLPAIRRAVASRIPKEHLPKMMNDDSEDVREMVAQRISPDYLPEMIDDRGEEVKFEVAKRIDKSYLPELLENTDDEDVKTNIAQRIDKEYLPRLVENTEDEGVKGLAAQRMNPEDLPMLMDEDDDDIREEVSKRIPGKFLEEMKDDPNVIVLKNVAERIGTKHLPDILNTVLLDNDLSEKPEDDLLGIEDTRDSSSIALTIWNRIPEMNNDELSMIESMLEWDKIHKSHLKKIRENIRENTNIDKDVKNDILEKASKPFKLPNKGRKLGKKFYSHDLYLLYVHTKENGGELSVKDIKDQNFFNAEDVQEFIKQMDGKKFTTKDIINFDKTLRKGTFDDVKRMVKIDKDHWTGMQKIFDRPNDVIQFNIPFEKGEEFAQKIGLTEYQLEKLKQENSNHPVSDRDYTLGWVRYTEFEDFIWIDEIQSDLDKFIEDEDILSIFKDLESFMLQRFVQIAHKKYGVRKIYMPDIQTKRQAYQANPPISIYKHLPKKARFKKTEVPKEVVKESDEIYKDNEAWKLEANIQNIISMIIAENMN